MVGRFCFGVVSNTSSSAGFHKGVLGPELPHQLTNKVALPPDSQSTSSIDLNGVNDYPTLAVD